ncbi:hypothetical protein Pint_10132 [Pistacia integerrima]|uniref:Uncharacterized protein n=1 Tax=Pistacia integerrima TaxID=434235 RepID=A0ACC0XG99_9ROSI|nr:hypothetical protein Pint_10132 [Pistacia integerrima]
MATNIGMMDSAYFVGRSEFLSWINSPKSKRNTYMTTNIGMIDSAYFVGRSEFLSWINSPKSKTNERNTYMTTNISTIDSAYFVSRSEFLSWINSPKSKRHVSMRFIALPTDRCGSSRDGLIHKINFDAKNEYVINLNYKVL